MTAKTFFKKIGWPASYNGWQENCPREGHWEYVKEGTRSMFRARVLLNKDRVSIKRIKVKEEAKGVKTCIRCRHWTLDPGCPAWSAHTPGEEWKMSCLKKHWHLAGYNVSEVEMRQTLKTAKSCPDYEEIKE